MFNGREYHHEFEGALDTLSAGSVDRDTVLGKLVGIELVLWEAIRGAMILTANLAALIVLAPISYLTWQAEVSGWGVGLALFLGWLTIQVGLYWLFRLAVFVEIGRHVKGRRFGDLDLPWLSSGTGYRQPKPTGNY